MESRRLIPHPLTYDQAWALMRIRDQGPGAWCRGRGRAGGAVARMFARLYIAGLCTSAPHAITDYGREALAAWEAQRARRPDWRFSPTLR